MAYRTTRIQSCALRALLAALAPGAAVPDTAVVKMVWNQRATVGDQDRSAVFFITDIWVRRPEGWRVVERHSSRPEPKATMLRQ